MSTLGVLGWQERIRALRDAMRGLSYLHTPTGSKGVVLHRDIKPPNILIDGMTGQAKLCDFGLARHSKDLGQSGGATHVTTKHLVGTPGYIDHLYADSGRFDQRTDLYAMGVTILVTLVGQPALQAKELATDLLEQPWSVEAAKEIGLAAGWPVDVVGSLARIVVGLSWVRSARKRMPIEVALHQLEALAKGSVVEII